MVILTIRFVFWLSAAGNWRGPATRAVLGESAIHISRPHVSCVVVWLFLTISNDLCLSAKLDLVKSAMSVYER